MTQNACVMILRCVGLLAARRLSWQRHRRAKWGPLRDALAHGGKEPFGARRSFRPPVLHGLFFNSRVSQRDHVALFIVRSFRQQRVPVPNREIAAHGFYSFDALPENTTPGTRARIAEVMLGAPLSERW